MNNNLLVLQSDFGLVDGAVSAMIGVALEESQTLKIHHLTHDITPYNIFEGSYWYSGCLFWTSITREEFYKLEPVFGDRFEVTIYHADMLVYQNQVVYDKSFADARIGQPILYINSLYRLGLAINQASFAKAYNVGVGSYWTIEIKKIEL